MFAWLAHEFAWRKKNGLSPASFREGLRLGQKNLNPHPPNAVLIFAFITVAFFALWESFLAFLFNRQLLWGSLIIALGLYAGAIYRRQRSFRVEGPERGRFDAIDVVLLTLFTLFFLQSWVVVIFSPWIFVRLKTSNLKRPALRKSA